MILNMGLAATFNLITLTEYQVAQPDPPAKRRFKSTRSAVPPATCLAAIRCRYPGREGVWGIEEFLEIKLISGIKWRADRIVICQSLSM